MIVRSAEHTAQGEVSPASNATTAHLRNLALLLRMATSQRDALGIFDSDVVEHGLEGGWFDGVADPFFDLDLAQVAPMMVDRGRNVICSLENQSCGDTGIDRQPAETGGLSGGVMLHTLTNRADAVACDAAAQALSTWWSLSCDDPAGFPDRSGASADSTDVAFLHA